jgi:hypothetical protein
MRPAIEHLRDRREELDLDTVGGFAARWYALGQAPHGPFHSTQELLDYMQASGLGRPDELITSADPADRPLRTPWTGGDR